MIGIAMLVAGMELAHPIGGDPAVDWARYLGGSENEWAFGLAIDETGSAVIAGDTGSADFEGATNEFHGGSTDVFVARVHPSGELDWVTYLGAGGGDLDFDIGRGVAIDGDGNILVCGWTNGEDFAGANNAYHGGTLDAFVARLTPDGALDWMTYLGGRADDLAFEISVDADGGALVAGETYSLDFEGRNNTFRGGAFDAFVARVHPSGEIDWMTYLGGGGGETTTGIVVDTDGSSMVLGDTWSAGFEGRTNSNHGATDVFIARIAASGVIDWMTYVGGSSNEQGGYGIAIDEEGAALACAHTTSVDIEGRTNSHHGGSVDAIVVRVERDGTLDWVTYLGGNEWDSGLDLALDVGGAALVAGRTESVDFDGRVNSIRGMEDAYLARVSPAGVLDWMMYVGGADWDAAFGVGIDGDGQVLLTGRTRSVDFEERINDFYGGDRTGDAFVARVEIGEAAAELVQLEMVDGELISGGIAELEESDDMYVETEARVTGEVAQPHLMRMRITADTDVQNPGAITITVEGRITDVEAQTTLLLRDWVNGDFVQVDQFSMGLRESVRVTKIQNAADFIRASDGLIRLEVKQIVFFPFTLGGFHTLLDEVEIEVR